MLSIVGRTFKIFQETRRIKVKIEFVTQTLKERIFLNLYTVYEGPKPIRRILGELVFQNSGEEKALFEKIKDVLLESDASWTDLEDET